MAVENATATLYSVATIESTPNYSVNTTVSLSATASVTNTPESTTLVVSLQAVASLTVSASVTKGIRVSSGIGSFMFRFKGNLSVMTRKIYLSQQPSGTVNNIEDLSSVVSPTDGMVYNVLGTAANREPIIAVYSSLTSSWFYQLGRNTTTLTYINPMIGTSVTMPDYINLNGVPHTPTYWDKSHDVGAFSYRIEAIEATPSVPNSEGGGSGSNTVWRWKVDDLADPGDGKKYALNSWAPHNGVGPTWYSKEFYRPQVKSTAQFNIKKNKTRKQRSVTFNYTQVDHLYMTCASLPQPFTVVIVGIINSYPTAKYGHYLLDSGTEPAIFDANKTGKDFFPDEGTNPRNVLLFQKTRARIAVNQQPSADLKVCDKNIKSKHTERARPRFFYGVFNGNTSRIGTMDTKYKFDQAGALSNYGGSTKFSIGRRVNRISDNRASHMCLWDITFFHRALSLEELTNYYQEMANTYQFKEYS